MLNGIVPVYMLEFVVQDFHFCQNLLQRRPVNQNDLLPAPHVAVPFIA